MRMLIGLVVFVVACGSGRVYGRVDLGDVIVEGEVDGNFFARQLDQLDPWFEACYARALRLDRSTEGIIRLRLRVREGGLTPEIIEDGPASPQLTDCVMSAVSNLTLVEPDTAAPWDFTAQWPITFSVIRRE